MLKGRPMAKAIKPDRAPHDAAEQRNDRGQRRERREEQGEAENDDEVPTARRIQVKPLPPCA